LNNFDPKSFILNVDNKQILINIDEVKDLLIPDMDLDINNEFNKKSISINYRYGGNVNLMYLTNKILWSPSYKITVFKNEKILNIKLNAKLQSDNNRNIG